MNANALIYHTILKDVIDKAQGEWENLWHNGRLKSFPYEDDESELFWDWLNDEARFMIEDIQDQIYEKWGFNWTIYSWGRSGATFAPDIEHMGRYFNSKALDLNDKLGIDDESEDVDEIKSWIESAKEYHEALKYINETIRSCVSGIDESWNEFKEANPELFEKEEDEIEEKAA